MAHIVYSCLQYYPALFMKFGLTYEHCSILLYCRLKIFRWVTSKLATLLEQLDETIKLVKADCFLELSACYIVELDVTSMEAKGTSIMQLLTSLFLPAVCTFSRAWINRSSTSVSDSLRAPNELSTSFSAYSFASSFVFLSNASTVAIFFASAKSSCVGRCS